jgi:hypothetical protein
MYRSSIQKQSRQAAKFWCFYQVEIRFYSGIYVGLKDRISAADQCAFV